MRVQLSRIIIIWQKYYLKKEIEKTRIIRNATHRNLRLFYKNIEMADSQQCVMDFNLEADAVIVAQINDRKSSNESLN